MPNVEKETEKEKDKIIDLPSDGPGAEVTLPEEPVKEGAQDVAVPEVKPEGEVEIKEEDRHTALGDAVATAHSLEILRHVFEVNVMGTFNVLSKSAAVISKADPMKFNFRGGYQTLLSDVSRTYSYPMR